MADGARDQDPGFLGYKQKLLGMRTSISRNLLHFIFFCIIVRGRFTVGISVDVIKTQSYFNPQIFLTFICDPQQSKVMKDKRHFSFNKCAIFRCMSICSLILVLT